MNIDTDYILYRKLDRRSYKPLTLYKKYYCEKRIYPKRPITNTGSIIKIKVKTDSGGFYLFDEKLFDNHFVTEKQYRKIKLEKLKKI